MRRRKRMFDDPDQDIGDHDRDAQDNVERGKSTEEVKSISRNSEDQSLVSTLVRQMV